MWAKSGQAFDTLNTDDDPYHADCTDDTNIKSDQHLTALLMKRHKSWRSYQEDANVDVKTNLALPMALWTYPIFSQNGLFTPPAINARVVPLIMASDAYQDGAVTALWWDETEGGDTDQFKIPFIVISKNAHKNVGGLPYWNIIKYSHSSFLRTMQEIFDVDPDEGFPFLGDAVNATDLRALFKPGTIK